MRNMEMCELKHVTENDRISPENGVSSLINLTCAWQRKAVLKPEMWVLPTFGNKMGIVFFLSESVPAIVTFETFSSANLASDLTKNENEAWVISAKRAIYDDATCRDYLITH